MPRSVRLPLAGILLLCASTVWAQQPPLIRDSYYELSPLYLNGPLIDFGPGTAAMTGTAVHLYERNGVGGKMVATAAIALLMAMGHSDYNYEGSTYGPGYRIDYYQEKTPEEKAADAKARNDAIDGTAKNEYQMDVQVFLPQEGISSARGFSWSLVPLSFGVQNFAVELGLTWARITDDVRPPDATVGETELQPGHFSYFGMPIRLIIGPIPQVFVELQFDWNWLHDNNKDAYETRSPNTMRALLTFNPIERLFLRGGAITSDFDFGGLVYTAEAGVRF